ncbi:DUF362 domain-containing protein [Thermodesulfobacteriota bacterium]
MKSKVFFASMRASIKESTLEKIKILLEKVELSKKLKDKDMVAIKLHFGEKGNTSYVRPVFLRPIVEKVKEAKAKPFLTDANTLYIGSRGNAYDHMQTAIENGFAYSVVGAPIIIADGLKSTSSTAVDINLEHTKSAHIGSEIVNSDAFIGISHFKCHELTGFGGTIKNIGMGSACRRGKLFMHSTVAPFVDSEACTACEDCLSHCAHTAISMSGEGKAHIDPETCVGCGECILVCSSGCIKINWNESVPTVQKKIVEYTHAVLKGKENKSVFLNFITQVSPACDCYGYNDAPIVPDIGIVASTDPVAIDQASADLVNNEIGFSNSALKSGHDKGGDKFKGVYDYIDWDIQLDYAEKIGLGQRDYELIKI